MRLAEFGAFVDLGGIDGLIHNSELSYARIKHPSEVVKIGDVVQVEIMKFDPEAKKVSLSLKHALPDPWDRARRQAVRRQQALAQVVKVTPNYLLVEIVPGVLAMVPKGEFDAAEQYSPGEDVEVTLLTINQATRRITGSIQHVADVPPEEIEKYAVEEIGVIGDVTPAAFDAAVESEPAPETEPAHAVPFETGKEASEGARFMSIEKSTHSEKNPKSIKPEPERISSARGPEHHFRNHRRCELAYRRHRFGQKRGRSRSSRIWAHS